MYAFDKCTPASPVKNTIIYQLVTAAQATTTTSVHKISSYTYHVHMYFMYTNPLILWVNY